MPHRRKKTTKKKKTSKKMPSLKKEGLVRAKGNKTERYNYWVKGVKKIPGKQVRVFKDTDKDGRRG